MNVSNSQRSLKGNTTKKSLKQKCLHEIKKENL